MKRIEVIVRAYGGKPLKRVVIGFGRGTLHIANPAHLDAVERGWSAPVGFQVEDVFLYDSMAWNRMERQWSERAEIDPEEWIRLIPCSLDMVVSRETVQSTGKSAASWQAFDAE